MEPIRVLVVAEAVNSTRVGWMLTLARKLDPRRFAVHLAWHPRFNHLLGPLDFPFHPLPGLAPSEYFERLSRLRPLYDLPVLERYVAWQLEVFRASAPSVVLGDMNPSLLTSTSVAGIPLVTLGLGYWSPHAPGAFSISELPVARRLNAAIHRTIFRLARPWIFGAYTRDLNKVNARFGGHRMKPDPRWYFSRGDWTLYTDLPGMSPLGLLPPNQRFMGPIDWSPPVVVHSSLDPGLGQPTVYVDWSPTWRGDLPRKIFQALVRLKGRVVVGAEDGAEFSVPPGWTREKGTVGASGFPQTDAVICSGGIGSVVSALTEGLPVIGIPTNIDQLLQMERVQKARVGLLVRPGRLKDSSFVDALDRIRSDPGVRDRARRMAEQIRAHDPGPILNEVVERAAEANPARISSLPRREVIPPGARSLPIAKESEARALVRAALWAPTAGNSQPLRYRWTGTDVEIRVDPERNNRFMDLAHTDLWAAVGGALFNMEVAANAAGKGLWVNLFPGGVQGLVARVMYTDSLGRTGVLADALETRSTNRRPYRDQPLDRLAREELERWAARPGIRLDWILDAAGIRRAAAALALFNRFLFGNENVGRCVLQWLRPQRRHAPDPADGMPVHSLELGAFPRFWLRGAMSPLGRSLLGPIFGRVSQREDIQRYRRTAAFGVVTLDDWEPGTMVRAGQSMQALWLAAAQHGIAIHPLAGPVLMEIRLRLGGIGFSVQERAWATRAHEDLATLVPGFGERVPFLVFRAGYADPPSSRSGRLPLEQVFDVSHGS